MATVFAVGVPWLTVAWNLVLPHIKLSGDYLTVIVAVFGTTISPYLSVAWNLVLPHIKLSGDYLTVIVAVFGTTIGPYLFFWQAGEEVEDQKEDPPKPSR